MPTVKELKEELRGHGLPTTGNKAALQARLDAFLMEQGPQHDKAGDRKKGNQGSDELPPKKPKHAATPQDQATNSANNDAPFVKKEEETVEGTPSSAVKEEGASSLVLKEEEEKGNQSAVKMEPTVNIKKSEEGVDLPASSNKSANGGDSDDDDDDDDAATMTAAQQSRNCPYLDTINRNMLDFDFEKLCSVSMSNQNVYACLVCGKYFQGRGEGTHAYMHSLEDSHHVYINLYTLKFYCLPDNYEIIDGSLDDIKFVLYPVYSKNYVEAIDTTFTHARGLDGTKYIPGVVGLNNIKANDYVNVVVQTLNRVTPFRNFFLDAENIRRIKDPLVQTMGDLIRKVNNPRAFKGHVSPHELLQAITTSSKKRFTIIKQSDPIQLLSWLLNTLDRKLQRHGVTIIADIFKGNMTVTSQKLPPTTDEALISKLNIDLDSEEFREKSQSVEFMYLGLDLPPAPLFHDAVNENIIPQVPLFELLNKFDGVSKHEYKTYKDTVLKTFRIRRMPRFLIMHVKRFTKNTFFVEKNPTIINFPVKDIDWSDYLMDEDKKVAGEQYRYNLVANIVHDGLPGAGEGTYRCHVLHKGSRQWFEVQDLHVADVLPEMITLSESYIQIWERNMSIPPAPQSQDGDGSGPSDDGSDEASGMDTAEDN